MRQGRINSLIPLDFTFKEDPVRLIRTVKYAATTGFSLPGKIKKALKKFSPELERAAVSRLTEELMKILAAGSSYQIINYCIEYNLLKYIVPEIAKHTDEKFMKSLQELDELVNSSESVGREYMIYMLTRTFLTPPSAVMVKTKTAFREVFKDIKAVISPLTPPNIEVEKAVVLYFKELGLNVKIPNAHNPRYRKSGSRRKRGPYKKNKPPGQSS